MLFLILTAATLASPSDEVQSRLGIAPVDTVSGELTKTGELTCEAIEHWLSTEITPSEVATRILTHSIPAYDRNCVIRLGVPEVTWATLLLPLDDLGTYMQSTALEGQRADQRRYATLKQVAYADIMAPDPAAAAIMSSVVGFGSGHYYAESEVSGSFFLVSQALGTGFMGAAAFGKYTPTDAANMMIAGTVILTVSRFIEVLSAPAVARKSALRHFNNAQ